MPAAVSSTSRPRIMLMTSPRALHYSLLLVFLIAPALASFFGKFPDNTLGLTISDGESLQFYASAVFDEQLDAEVTDHEEETINPFRKTGRSPGRSHRWRPLCYRDKASKKCRSLVVIAAGRFTGTLPLLDRTTRARPTTSTTTSYSELAIAFPACDVADEADVEASPLITDLGTSCDSFVKCQLHFPDCTYTWLYRSYVDAEAVKHHGRTVLGVDKRLLGHEDGDETGVGVEAGSTSAPKVGTTGATTRSRGASRGLHGATGAGASSNSELESWTSTPWEDAVLASATSSSSSDSTAVSSEDLHVPAAKQASGSSSTSTDAPAIKQATPTSASTSPRTKTIAFDFSTTLSSPAPRTAGRRKRKMLFKGKVKLTDEPPDSPTRILQQQMQKTKHQILPVVGTVDATSSSRMFHVVSTETPPILSATSAEAVQFLENVEAGDLFENMDLRIEHVVYYSNMQMQILPPWTSNRNSDFISSNNGGGRQNQESSTSPPKTPTGEDVEQREQRQAVGLPRPKPPPSTSAPPRPRGRILEPQEQQHQRPRQRTRPRTLMSVADEHAQLSIADEHGLLERKRQRARELIYADFESIAEDPDHGLNEDDDVDLQLHDDKLEVGKEKVIINEEDAIAMERRGHDRQVPRSRGVNARDAEGVDVDELTSTGARTDKKPIDAGQTLLDMFADMEVSNGGSATRAPEHPTAAEIARAKERVFAMDYEHQERGRDVLADPVLRPASSVPLQGAVDILDGGKDAAHGIAIHGRGKGKGTTGPRGGGGKDENTNKGTSSTTRMHGAHVVDTDRSLAPSRQEVIRVKGQSKGTPTLQDEEDELAAELAEMEAKVRNYRGAGEQNSGTSKTSNRAATAEQIARELERRVREDLHQHSNSMNQNTAAAPYDSDEQQDSEQHKGGTHDGAVGAPGAPPQQQFGATFPFPPPPPDASAEVLQQPHIEKINLHQRENEKMQHQILLESEEDEL